MCLVDRPGNEKIHQRRFLRLFSVAVVTRGKYSLRADVSISFASRGKGRLRNAVPNRVPVSRCFSRIRGPSSDWFLNSRHS